MTRMAPPQEKFRPEAKGPADRKVPSAVPPEARRSFATLPLAQLVPAVTRIAFKKRSPAGATLMADWAVVVGSQLAAVTEPRRLARGVLTIACAGPTAVELQHLQAMLIDRINAHAGGTIVEKLRFVQDHVQPASVSVKPLPPGEPERLHDMPEGPLSDALAVLRQAMRHAAPPRGR